MVSAAAADGRRTGVLPEFDPDGELARYHRQVYCRAQCFPVVADEARTKCRQAKQSFEFIAVSQLSFRAAHRILVLENLVERLLRFRNYFQSEFSAK